MTLPCYWLRPHARRARSTFASVEPDGGTVLRGAAQPRVLNHLGKLVALELGDATRPEEHRRVAAEVWRGEERRPVVLHERLLLGLGLDPEHDHVLVALSGRRIESVGSRSAEEDE